MFKYAVQMVTNSFSSKIQLPFMPKTIKGDNGSRDNVTNQFGKEHLLFISKEYVGSLSKMHS